MKETHKKQIDAIWKKIAAEPKPGAPVIATTDVPNKKIASKRKRYKPLRENNQHLVDLFETLIRDYKSPYTWHLQNEKDSQYKLAKKYSQMLGPFAEFLSASDAIGDKLKEVDVNEYLVKVDPFKGDKNLSLVKHYDNHMPTQNLEDRIEDQIRQVTEALEEERQRKK